MKIDKFASKNKFSNTDKDIVVKLHGTEEREEIEWFNLLKDKVNFDNSTYLSEIRKNQKIEKIEKGKEKNKQAESKNK